MVLRGNSYRVVKYGSNVADEVLRDLHTKDKVLVPSQRIRKLAQPNELMFQNIIAHKFGLRIQHL
jgi:hypothetical protein